MNVNLRAMSESIIGIFFSIFLNMKVWYVFSLESPHRDDSNEYTQYIIFNIYIKENQLKLSQNLQLFGFLQGTQRRVQNSRGKRAISVRATESLLYVHLLPSWIPQYFQISQIRLNSHNRPLIKNSENKKILTIARIAT